MLKKDLTGPTLLEMSGNATYRDLARATTGADFESHPKQPASYLHFLDVA